MIDSPNKISIGYSITIHNPKVNLDFLYIIDFNGYYSLIWHLTYEFLISTITSINFRHSNLT